MESLDNEFWYEVEKLKTLSQISRIRVDRDDPSILLREMTTETGVTKDQLLPSGSAKYIQPTVIQISHPSIAPKPSKIKSLSQFTVRSNHAEFSPVTSKADLPNLHVSQKPEPETITEVVEIPSSQSTPLVPPPDLSECSLRLDSHPDSCVSPGDMCFYCKCPMENSYRCFRCICEKCGNNCSSGYCTVCNRFINQIQTYSCEFCGGPHYESVCQSGNSFVYEQFSDNNQNLQNDQYPYDSPYQTQQFNYCEYCEGPHFSSDCQTGNPFPCNSYDSSGYDQPPQYDMVQTNPQPRPQSELTQTELIAIMMNDQIQINENLQAELNCLKNQILIRQHPPVNSFYYEDDSDEDESVEDEPVDIPLIQTSQGEKSMIELLAETASPSELSQPAVITPEVHTNSLNMGDEHLDTIPAKESDVFIKSSVENLVPIQSESQGILEHLCDIPPPLIFPTDHVEMFSDSNDDESLSCGDIIYVEEFPSELISLEEENDEVTDTEIKDEALRATLLKVSLLISKIEAFNEKPISSPIPIKDSDILSDDSIPEMEAFCFDTPGEVISGNTTYESFTFEEFPKELTQHNVEYDSFTFEEFSCELTHAMSQPEYDSFHFDLDIPIICLHQVNVTDDTHENINAPAEDDELVMIIIMIFFLYFTYRVTYPVLHSIGSEDIIYDPGILLCHL